MISKDAEKQHDELALASLFEQEFSIDWLIALSNVKASQIVGSLENEVRKGTILSKGQGIYAFHDPKRKRELHATLTEEQREFFRRNIAAVIQEDVLDEKVAAVEIARHLIHAANDASGCRWLYKAAEVHQALHRPDQALKLYLKIITDLWKTRTDAEDILFINAAIAVSKNQSIQIKPGEIIKFLENALSRVSSESDQNISALLQMHLAKNEWIRGQTTRALAHYKNGLALADKSADEELQDSIALFKMWFNFWFGRFEEAVREYKKYLPVIDHYPDSQFPIQTTIIFGNCLVYSGQYNQGLGMLNALYDHSLKIGDTQAAAMAELGLGVSFIAVRKPEEAIIYLEDALVSGDKINNYWVRNSAYQSLGYAYYLIGKIDRSEEYVKKWLKSSRENEMSHYMHPEYMEILWAIKKGLYPPIPELDLLTHIDGYLNSQSPFAKGIAYRYQAFWRQLQGEADNEIKESLDLSIQHLEESGCPLEIARTSIEMGRYYFKTGAMNKATEWVTFSDGLMASIHKSIVPADLQHLVSKNLSEKNLLKEIIALSQEIVSIRESREVVNNIMATANRIVGAERSAIFMLEGKPPDAKLYLRASKNLTEEEIEEKAFHPAMEMIRQTTKTNHGNVRTFSGQDSSARLAIRSSVCMPMINRGEIMGVLYLDNRLLAFSFDEKDMEILSFFAALAAIALDNVQAYAEIQAINQRLEEEKKYYEEKQFEHAFSEEIIGKSVAIKKVIEHVERVSKSDTTVLILGETGAGKEVVANAIHRHSLRSDKPYIRVNCSALPESLITSEFFGHEKGAYTGAIGRRMGRFELADGGTLFLDEIGELPLEIQVRLLRILQTKQFERVGGNQTLKSDFRLILATSRNLVEEVENKRFRQDLFYRINVFPIEVPPLRSRSEDIPILAYYFLKMYKEKMKKPVSKITQAVMDKLVSYAWPGNVRELENVMERGVILSTDTVFRLPDLASDSPLAHLNGKNTLTFEENEREFILNALKLTRGKINGKGGAADLLKINRNTLYYRMKKLGIKK